MIINPKIMDMKKFYSITVVAALIGFSQQTNAQVIIQDDTTFNTASQLLLANELFESGEPFAEALGYNLDNLDPMVLNSPDTVSYTTGIENYEYSRYILGTLTARSAMGLNMMWSPVVMEKAAMQDDSFDGMFTGGMKNGYKEDDMLMMMMGMFGMHANQMPPANAFPQFADFAFGNMHLPQAVATDFQMDFSSLRWDRSKMDKTLNPGAMGQAMWKQYFWAQDMLSAFHDGDDNGIEADGTISPDSVGNPNFDPNNNVYYGGNSADGYIGQVLTAVSINKTKLLITKLAYDGTNLGMVDPATYDPANGIKYFPTKIAVTETMITGLPPKASTYTVTDPTSKLFDQLSFLLATTGFKNMMNPNDNSDAAHLAYKAVFDGNPFPADMSTTGTPGPYDLMMGTSKVLFLNLMAMHYNLVESTFIDEATLSGSGMVVMEKTITAENAGYIITALSRFSEGFTGTPLQPMADAALIAQADYILANLKDDNGGFYNSYTIDTGASGSAKTLAANGALIKGLYAAYQTTGDMNYLNEANDGYNYLINNFYMPATMVFKTTMNENEAVYTPWNLAILSGTLREATLTGNQVDAEKIYARVSKTVYNGMVLAEAEPSGETGGDSDDDGIPYIVGGMRPFVFAEKGVYPLTTTGIFSARKSLVDINVYPNPATEYISVEFDVEQTSDITVIIYDITGSAVISKSESNLRGFQNINIPLSGIHSGSYIVRILFNNEPVAIKKLIVR